MSAPAARGKPKGEMGSARVSNSPCSLTSLQMYHHKREERTAGRDVENTGERTCLVHVRLGARQAGAFIGPLIDTGGGAGGGARSPLCRNKRAQPKPQPPQRRATMQWCGERHQPRESQSAATHDGDLEEGTSERSTQDAASAGPAGYKEVTSAQDTRAIKCVKGLHTCGIGSPRSCDLLQQVRHVAVLVPCEAGGDTVGDDAFVPHLPTKTARCSNTHTRATQGNAALDCVHALLTKESHATMVSVVSAVEPARGVVRSVVA